MRETGRVQERAVRRRRPGRVLLGGPIVADEAPEVASAEAAAPEVAAEPEAAASEASARAAAPRAAAAPTRRRPLARAFAAAEALAMVAGGVAALVILAGHQTAAQDDARALPGIRLGGQEVGGKTADELAAIAAEVADAGLGRPLELRAGEASTMTTARELGALPSPEAAIAAALEVGRSGDLLTDIQARAAAERGDIDVDVGYRFDEKAALARLLELAPAVERPSLPTRFDFAERKVIPASRGTSLLAFDSLSTVAVGLASGAKRIDLVVQERAPVDDPLAEIAETLDIHEVLGTFSTPYHNDLAHADRTHNIKLGALALDGHVLMPGETMSFNEVVGERSDSAGFRYAPGITAGELVDTVGGGTCQVSSTLYGAAFFSGLELVHARPHSRPSSYVDMGLDSTVVDGMIDMKLRNPYDFPVVLHTTVSGGEVVVEVLGAKRPYKVAFEREITEVLPYTSVVRDDGHLRSGATAVAQQGKRGFKVIRRRKLYAAEGPTNGEAAVPLKTEEWELYYPPTTEIVRRGSNPAGELPEGAPPPKLRDPAHSLRIVK
ncbi:MAG: VanW family protein [Myxococcales bacterium]|nr:VanW family protein [Myxococcales bacterium]